MERAFVGQCSVGENSDGWMVGWCGVRAEGGRGLGGRREGWLRKYSGGQGVEHWSRPTAQK